MNGCTIRYKLDNGVCNRTSAGRIIDSKKDIFVIHTADNDIKAIRFNPIHMNGKLYNHHSEIYSTDVLGFRRWDSPFEVNIRFSDRGSNRNSNQGYNINFYGCVQLRERKFKKDKLNIKINNNNINFEFSENDLYIRNKGKITLHKTQRNNKLFNGQIINLGLKEPVKKFCVGDTNYDNKINVGLYETDITI